MHSSLRVLRGPDGGCILCGTTDSLSVCLYTPAGYLGPPEPGADPGEGQSAIYFVCTPCFQWDIPGVEHVIHSRRHDLKGRELVPGIKRCDDRM